MKDIVYIVPLTPERLLTPLRKLLHDISLKALKEQTSANWEALLVGEYDKTEGNIRYLPAKALDLGYQKADRGNEGATDKHFKIDVAMQFIERQDKKPRYIARLDDDDIISPNIVSLIEKNQDNYDCFSDYYQGLVDTTTGKVCLPHLPWMANTTFHKYEHAKTFITDQGCGLINTSHNKGFHPYYMDKKVWWAPQYNPVYLRTLSPSSYSLASQDYKLSFNQHVKKFGFWEYRILPEYEKYLVELFRIFEVMSNTKISRNFSKSYRLRALASYYYHKRFDNFFPRLANKLSKGNTAEA